MNKKTKMTTGDVVNLMLGAMHKNVHLKLSNGTERHGRITGIVSRAITVNGSSIDWPIKLELNGDPGDAIHLDNVTAVSVA